MAALPLLITTATIAYSMFFPTDRDGKLGDSRVGSSSSLLSATSGRSISSFLYGIIVGVGISWSLSYEFRRRRLWQHLRLKVLSWLYDSSGSTTSNGSEESNDDEPPRRLVDKFRTPVRISDLVGNPIPRMDADNEFCGTHLELLSPDWALSPNLHVDVVTLPTSAELVPNKTHGVEFYYVLKGDGSYIRNGEVHRISVGMGFIVDPECTRGFAVRGRSGDLVLLRATDTALPDDHNVSRLQASSLSSTVAIVNAGLTKIQQMVGSTTTTGGVSRPSSTSSVSSFHQNSPDQ